MIAPRVRPPHAEQPLRGVYIVRRFVTRLQLVLVTQARSAVQGRARFGLTNRRDIVVTSFMSIRSSGLMTTTEAAIWERLIRPERNDLSPEAARSILRFTFSRNDRKRMHQLSLKNQGGKLTDADRAELDGFCHVGMVLDLMRAKARRSLRRASASR